MQILSSGASVNKMTDWKTTTLGKTGWKVGRLGLASSYGADERCVQMAVERGVNYLYWGSMRTAKFGDGLRSLRSRRDEFRLVIQSYSRVAAMVPWSLERALKSLGTDHADILLLGMWNKDVSPAIFDRALRLRERGLIRAIAVSTHNRPQAEQWPTTMAMSMSFTCATTRCIRALNETSSQNFRRLRSDPES